MRALEKLVRSLQSLLVALAVASVAGCSDGEGEGAEGSARDSGAEMATGRDASPPVGTGRGGNGSGGSGAASGSGAISGSSAAGGSSGAGGTTTAPRDGAVATDQDAAIDEVPFQLPGGGADYDPEGGKCGFADAAFCDAFEQGPMQGGRSGELDPARWSVLRAGPSDHPDFDSAFTVGPTLLPACRSDLPRTVLPDSDVLICEPVPGVATRHLLTAAAAQNYGLSTYRIRQPFDFAGRTATIKLDVDLSNNGLGGWPALVIAEDPSPAPSFDWEERGSGPRNGLEIELNGGWCNTPRTLEVGLHTFRALRAREWARDARLIS